MIVENAPSRSVILFSLAICISAAISLFHWNKAEGYTELEIDLSEIFLNHDSPLLLPKDELRKFYLTASILEVAGSFPNTLDLIDVSLDEIFPTPGHLLNALISEKNISNRLSVEQFDNLFSSLERDSVEIDQTKLKFKFHSSAFTDRDIENIASSVAYLVWFENARLVVRTLETELEIFTKETTHKIEELNNLMKWNDEQRRQGASNLIKQLTFIRDSIVTDPQPIQAFKYAEGLSNNNAECFATANAENLFQELTMYLPMLCHMTPKDIDNVIANIDKFLDLDSNHALKLKSRVAYNEFTERYMAEQILSTMAIIDNKSQNLKNSSDKFLNFTVANRRPRHISLSIFLGLVLISTFSLLVLRLSSNSRLSN